MNNLSTKQNSLFHPVDIAHVHLPGNIFLAPVAGYSDRAFRSVCYDLGCNFSYTEMVSTEALIRCNLKTEQLMQRALNEPQYAVQIFGSNPDSMGMAACIVQQTMHPEVIDINCGCPVPKIIKTGSGSALTRDPEKLGAVVHAVKKSLANFTTEQNKTSSLQTLPAPVTVKIRSGWDSSSLTWKEAALAALENGADAITLHPRTRAQGYEGKADWTILAQLVELIDNRIPVSSAIFFDVNAPVISATVGHLSDNAAVRFVHTHTVWATVVDTQLTHTDHISKNNAFGVQL